jgi:hypothetical protein
VGKLYTAVNILATGQGTVQERLGSAYRNSLTRLRGMEKESPEGIRPDLEQLEKALTREKPTGNEGTIEATIRTMESDEATRHAERSSARDSVARIDRSNERIPHEGREAVRSHRNHFGTKSFTTYFAPQSSVHLFLGVRDSLEPTVVNIRGGCGVCRLSCVTKHLQMKEIYECLASYLGRNRIADCIRQQDRRHRLVSQVFVVH